MRSRTRLHAALLAVAVALVAGCVSENRPETCDAASVRLELTVRADGMQPTDPGACVGQEVVFAIAPEVDGVFHVHGYDHAVPATTIVSGEPVELTFTADRTGQFPIELHPADDPQGVHIGVFTVYER